MSAPDDALRMFQEAGEHDSAGREEEAEPLYRAALAAGLPSAERVQATIQLASTIRNLDRPEESLALLEAEADGRAVDEWTPALAAFTALTLASLGRDREALVVALRGIVPSLPRYHRSVTAYAQELADGVR
jgi:thioredoxin-like negative regulator of GroEL